MNTIKKFIFTGICAFILLGFASEEVEAFQSERHIGIVRKFKPEVLLKNKDVNERFNLTLEENLGEKLFAGDSLFTEEGAYALVLFMDRSVAKVKPNSLLTINGEVANTDKQTNTRINLKNGEVFLEVQPQGNNDFEVSTSRSLASVKGTNFGSTSDGFVWVENGQVDLTALNSGQTISLFEKMYGQVDEDGNEIIDQGTLDDDEINNLKEGYDEMEEDYIQKEVTFRFRDQNGQIREITIEFFEREQN